MNIKREDITVDGTRLILEDRINTLHPQQSERVLWIAGTDAFYSAVPLSPDSHRLLCFNYCADALKMRQPDPFYHALVLGCGGGAIPRWLLEEYPSVTVDVVDRSPEIISMCRKYFLDRWDDSDRLKYHCVDAKDYDGECRYQFIFCDLFDGERLAPVVYEPGFAEKLRNLVSDDGFVIVNCGWGSPVELKTIYRSSFKNVQIFDRESWQTQVIMACP